MRIKSAYSIDWNAPFPDEIAMVPSQLGDDCRAAYFHAARNFFSGSGAIVDSGTLAGGSSLALLEGWKASGRPVARAFLHAFDMFLCDDYTASFFRDNFGGEWRQGDNFRRIYEQSIGQYARYASIYEGDITKHQTWTGAEIEILGVDVWKSEQIALHCVRLFFPHLCLGAIVLQQDYNHIWLPHIHRIMEVFSDHFEKIHETRYGGTVVFQLVRKFTDAELVQGLSRQADCDEGRMLAESAAFRARHRHTSIFIMVADCIREAKFRGANQALTNLENVRIASLQLDDEFRKFFAGEIEQAREYIKSAF